MLRDSLFTEEKEEDGGGTGVDGVCEEPERDRTMGKGSAVRDGDFGLWLTGAKSACRSRIFCRSGKERGVSEGFSQMR